jgi:photosystem II stability/assembly factor-like uncharacterized protein
MRILTTSIAVALALSLVAVAQMPAPSPFAGLTWRSIGPVNTSGRIDDFAVARVPGQSDAIYVGTATGGVFKSVNGGVSWSPVFDHVDGMMSIGDLAVAPSNPNVVWAGTGEANNRQSSSWGDGVYKSVDAGQTWANMGLRETRHIARIVVDPANADVVYVAAVGHLWGPNPERGVFKTTDGGSSWKKVLFIDENTGANDIVMDPQNPKILVASMYQRQRKEWGFDGGGPGSGIYRSTDAGATWHPVTKGLPAGDKGRIGLDIFKGDGKFVEAIVEAAGGEGRGCGARAPDASAPPGAGGRGAGRGGPPPANTGPATPGGGLYRSLDGGESWEFLSPQDVRPSYYSQIRIDPRDRNRVYELGSNRGFCFSDDGGRTFTDRGVSGVHGEDHALWVDPDNSSHLIVGGDGGVSISWDRGITWDFRMNMPIGQFYEIDVNNKIPYTVCGGLQDNGEWCVPSASRDRNGISAADGWNIGGGDGFYVKFDPTDEDYAYAESQDGNMSRVNIRTMVGRSIKPAGAQGAHRWNWDTPILVSSADPHVIYTGAEVLFRSSDRGTTWSAISPDLSAQIDPKTLEMMGTHITAATTLSFNDGSSLYGSMTTIGESPIDPRVLYTGMDDGTVQVTRNGGQAWTNVTSHITGLPPHTYVSSLLPSRYVAGRVYGTFDGHFNDDYKPYVFASEDYGQTWRPLGAGLPETSINRIREHPRSQNVLILAHERGVHVSNDGGQSWMPLSLVTNLPSVRTDDAIVQARDNALVIGTHGRGIWILDDMGPIEALTPAALKEDAVLAPIAPAREMIVHSPQAWFGTGTFFAPNPDFEAGINYYLRDGASGAVQVEISDYYYRIVRTLQGPTAKGLNRVRWDLRGEPAPLDPNAPAAGGRGGGRGRASGLAPFVTPGVYQVTVRIPGLARELHGTITVEADPIGGR